MVRFYPWDMAIEIDRLRERAHIIEGLLLVLDDGPAFLVEIGGRSDRVEALERVMKTWRLSEQQAVHVLDAPFRRATKLEQDRLRDQLAELNERIEELGSPPKR